MLKFNTLLKENNIDPITVQLVRHQQTGPTGLTPYVLLRTDPERFEAYQRLQGRQIFNRDFMAAFVVTPTAETLFANLYRVSQPIRNHFAINCPISLKEFEPEKIYVYELLIDERLKEFSQRLTINWGDGYRSWVQRAYKQNKDIIEISQSVHEDPFPGYDKFWKRLGDLSNPSPTERTALSIQKGVYLLTFDDGQQYVGSATGGDGFWQRWQDYLKNGHGGNLALKGRDARQAMVSILETSRLTDTKDDILSSEYLWHRKLGTRAIRLDDDNEHFANE